MWIDDQILTDYKKNNSCKIWTPQNTIVVVGRGNRIDQECFTQKCTEQKVEIKRRYGGGGAVVLHDQCLIISLGLWVKDFFQNDLYFEKINDAIIDTFIPINHTFRNLEKKGISDIAYKNKKLVGSSMFRSRNYLLFQASILYDNKIALINEYLKHPSKEPDYRKNKTHQEFLTSVKEIYKDLSLLELEKTFKDNFIKHVLSKFQDDLLDSIIQQHSALEKRLQNSVQKDRFSFL